MLMGQVPWEYIFRRRPLQIHAATRSIEAFHVPLTKKKWSMADGEWQKAKVMVHVTV
jgi:hypothetical protein